MARGLATRQAVDPVKAQAARELRRQATPEERQLWAALRGNQLCGLHFRRQQVIAGFIVDFYCSRASLVVELDGAVHASQLEYDDERDRVLAGLGLRVLRIPNSDVTKDLPAVLTDIATAAGFGPHPLAPSP